MNFAVENQIFSAQLRTPHAAKAFERILQRAGFALCHYAGKVVSIVEATKLVGITNTVRDAVDSEAFYMSFTAEEQAEIHAEVVRLSKETANKQESLFFRSRPALPASSTGSIEPSKTFSKDLSSVLVQLGLPCEIRSEKVGPTFHSLHIIPQQGVKVSKILSCGPDISVRLGQRVRVHQDASDSRLLVDIPRANRQFPTYKQVMSNASVSDDMELPIVLGADVGGEAVVMDLAEMPHLLVCGTTGSGKSVMVKSMIASLMQARPDVGFIISDPKRVEMKTFQGHPSMMGPILTETPEVMDVLQQLCNEMDRRFMVLDDASCTDIAAYRHRGGTMPYLVVVIDELADVMMTCKKAAEPLLVRLAQKARAAGIHLLLCTQRPSVDVVTGLLKSNIPARIALRCASAVDSRVALDSEGAESLLGKGDAIVRAKGMEIRVQSPFFSNGDI